MHGPIYVPRVWKIYDGTFAKTSVPVRPNVVTPDKLNSIERLLFFQRCCWPTGIVVEWEIQRCHWTSVAHSALSEWWLMVQGCHSVVCHSSYIQLPLWQKLGTAESPAGLSWRMKDFGDLIDPFPWNEWFKSLGCNSKWCIMHLHFLFRSQLRTPTRPRSGVGDTEMPLTSVAHSALSEWWLMVQGCHSVVCHSSYIQLPLWQNLAQQSPRQGCHGEWRTSEI